MSREKDLDLFIKKQQQQNKKLQLLCIISNILRDRFHTALLVWLSEPSFHCITQAALNSTPPSPGVLWVLGLQACATRPSYSNIIFWFAFLKMIALKTSEYITCLKKYNCQSQRDMQIGVKLQPLTETQIKIWRKKLGFCGLFFANELWLIPTPFWGSFLPAGS